MARFILLAVCALLFAPIPGFAADPPPFPEFTFKRAKPPKAGVRRRITVQIEAEPVQDADPAGSKAEAVEPREATYSWFWEEVPPGIDANSADRLKTALALIRRPPADKAVPSPRLQTMQAIVKTHGAQILQETIGARVSPALVLAVIAVESSGRSGAVSDKGAQGLMQLMPDTARRFGVEDSLTPQENIRGGVAYLNWLIEEFDGDTMLALAGYNAGENAVKKHKGIPPYAETRDYVPKVLAAFDVARGLCQTQPELITDACALKLALN